MHWYWKVRLYASSGMYVQGQLKTNRVLFEIDTIQDFYKDLTGCKMLLEGMSETSFDIPMIDMAFHTLWVPA